jgi:hypothetical protein
MNEPRYRDEFDRLTASGVRRLVQANLYEKSVRAVTWLQERGQLQDHQEEKQENDAIARARASTERGTDLEQSQAGPAGVPSSAAQGWRSLLKWEWMPTLSVLLGGVLLQSMNVLMLTTVLPSIVGELGGVAMLTWPTTAFLASSIVAASCAGVLASSIGARTTYCIGVVIFGLGALLCSLGITTATRFACASIRRENRQALSRA